MKAKGYSSRLTEAANRARFFVEHNLHGIISAIWRPPLPDPVIGLCAVFKDYSSRPVPCVSSTAVDCTVEFLHGDSVDERDLSLLLANIQPPLSCTRERKPDALAPHDRMGAMPGSLEDILIRVAQRENELIERLSIAVRDFDVQAVLELAGELTGQSPTPVEADALGFRFSGVSAEQQFTFFH